MIMPVSTTVTMMGSRSAGRSGGGGSGAQSRVERKIAIKKKK